MIKAEQADIAFKDAIRTLSPAGKWAEKKSEKPPFGPFALGSSLRPQIQSVSTVVARGVRSALHNR